MTTVTVHPLGFLVITNTGALTHTGTANVTGAVDLDSTLLVGGLITASAGIAFGNETLSAYDEGTWTPVVADAASAGNVGTAATAVGFYTKIGKVVTVSCRLIDINTTGMTAGNQLFIRGLPFASKNSANYRAVAAVQLGNITFSGFATIQIIENVSYAQVILNTTGAALATLLVSALTSGSADIIFSATYLTES